jgi:hypothetical protein
MTLPPLHCSLIFFLKISTFQNFHQSKIHQKLKTQNYIKWQNLLNGYKMDKKIVMCVDYKLVKYKQHERQPYWLLLTHKVFFF